jgi:hypothetical protein
MQESMSGTDLHVLYLLQCHTQWLRQGCTGLEKGLSSRLIALCLYCQDLPAEAFYSILNLP